MMRGLARGRGKPLSRARAVGIAAAAVLAAGTAALAVTTAGTPANASSAAQPQSPAHYQGPRLTMIRAAADITATGYPKSRTSKQVLVSVDPGVWLASLGSP